MSAQIVSPPVWDDFTDPKSKTRIEQAKKDQIVYVDASYLLPARRFLIKTTDLAVRYYKYLCNGQTRQELQELYRKCYVGLLNWKMEDTDTHRREAEWNNYCNEILAVYVMRHLLHGHAIPARLSSAVTTNEIRRL